MLKRPAFIISEIGQSIFNKFLKNKHNVNEISLQHKNIYVLPSKLGMQFLLIALLNFVMGINYQNNLILAMAYLMVVILVFSILTGYKNMRGLSVKYLFALNSYAPKSPYARYQLQSTSSSQQVKLMISGSESETISLDDSDKKTIEIALNCTKRGVYGLEKAKIISHFPFGLVSVWSYIQPSDVIYVYPTPKSAENLDIELHEELNDAGDNAQSRTGSDEFYQLTPFIIGSALNKVSWKHYAKTQQLLSKEFTSDTTQELALNFNMLCGNTEYRLSQLCFLVNQLTEQQIAFSLTLPKKKISKASGDVHQTACLKALAEH